MSQASGSPWATTTRATPGASSATGETEMAGAPPKLTWRIGEVSSYLTDEIGVGDGLELRGPIGGWFAWEAREGGPLLLVAGGSGIAPLMAMIRHRKAAGNATSVRLLYSSRSYEEIIFREELETLS